MLRLLLGLDIGSTVAKAAVFDRHGRALAVAARRIRVHTPRPGWVERDPAESWRACAAVLRAVARGRGGAIAAIGLTGCGNGAVFLDERERPVRQGILSSDTRAAEFVGNHRRRARQTAYPGQTAALLRWVRAREPRVARRVRLVLFWKDFIRLRLTGEPCTDFTDAGASGLLDVESRHWRGDDRVLPPLRESLAAAGVVQAAAAVATGLRAGTPVFTGCIDCEAAAIGSGVSGRGELSVVAGTWSINQTFTTKLPPAALFLINPSAQPGRWLLLEGSPTSAANFDWATRALFGRHAFSRAAALAERAAPGGDLLFIPRVSEGLGAFLGLAASHTRAELLRAVMTGVVFAHRWHVEKLYAAGVRCRTLRLTGGATRSRFWCQLFADAFGRPVEVPRGEETGALGAALCAGVGAGFWPSLRAAQRDTVAVARVFRPRRSANLALERDYARFRKHFPADSP
ncbi:MAG: carbohydrate kinase [Opitutus sp.]|nr:carbohydrate kinase [Opitutus sp.]